MKQILAALGAGAMFVAALSGAVILVVFPTAQAHADSTVDRVIDSRGELIVCLTFQTMGLTQHSLDTVAEHLMTVPAVKLSPQQAIEVIQGSVETYCPEFSTQIAAVFASA